MFSATTLSYFFGFWTAIYLFDYGLRSNSLTRAKYSELMSKCGITLSPLSAGFFTTRPNQLFSKIGSMHRVPWALWFSIGTIFTVFAMFFSLILLAVLIYNTFYQSKIENQVITTVVPGVNLPLNHIWIYFLTLLVCAILHEAGHAIAAFHERVRLQGFGLSLYGIYPAAYVNLNSEDLFSISPFSQLRIYCAGVWHNFIVVVLAAIVLYQLPVFLAPVYATGNGVGVVYLAENSVLSGTRGLSLGDAIVRINSCQVNNQSDWIRCLEEAQNRPIGYCVSASYLTSVSSYQSPLRRSVQAVAMSKKEEEKQPPRQEFGPQLAHPPSASEEENAEVDDCCPAERAATHMCFVFYSANRAKVQPTRVCLPARSVTERKSCYSVADCGASVSLAEGFPVTPRPSCIIPSPSDNVTRLVRVQHKRGLGLLPDFALEPKTGPAAILFLGPIKDLLEHVGVTDFVPRWPSLPFSPQLPLLVQTFCSYLFSLSGALLLFNVVPCYMLDGQYILGALLEILLPGSAISARTRKRTYNGLLWLGTALIGLNVLLASRQLLMQHLAA